MTRRIKSLFTFGLLNGKKLLDLNKRDKLMALQFLGTSDKKQKLQI